MAPRKKNPVETKVWVGILSLIDGLLVESERYKETLTGASKTLEGYKLDALKHVQRSLLAKVRAMQEQDNGSE